MDGGGGCVQLPENRQPAVAEGHRRLLWVQLTLIRSTTKIRVSPGLIALPAPRSP
jgi:hypothetical protein